MTLDNTSKIADIIAQLQAITGIDQKDNLKAVLQNMGITFVGTETIADMITMLNTKRMNELIASYITSGHSIFGTVGSYNKIYGPNDYLPEVKHGGISLQDTGVSIPVTVGYGIPTDDGELYIITPSSGIKKYDSTGNLKWSITDTTVAAFSGGSNLCGACDGNGNIVVFAYPDYTLKKYRKTDGTLLATSAVLFQTGYNCASLIYDDGLDCFFGASSMKVFRLNASTLATVWTNTTDVTGVQNVTKSSLNACIFASYNQYCVGLITSNGTVYLTKAYPLGNNTYNTYNYVLNVQRTILKGFTNRPSMALSDMSNSATSFNFCSLYGNISDYSGAGVMSTLFNDWMLFSKGAKIFDAFARIIMQGSNGSEQAFSSNNGKYIAWRDYPITCIKLKQLAGQILS